MGRWCMSLHYLNFSTLSVVCFVTASRVSELIAVYFSTQCQMKLT